MLLVVPWDDTTGGVTSVVKHLSEHLRQRGHGVMFMHPDRNAIATLATSKLGFPSIRLKLKPRPPGGWTLRALLRLVVTLPFTTLQLVYLLRVYRIDVVNVHFAVGQFAYFALCKRLAPIRLVTSIHGADFFPQGRPRASIGVSVRYLLRRSDLIVAPSRAFLAQFQALVPNIHTKVRAIHNGIDLTTFAPCPVPAHDEPRTVLSIAQHEPKKGLDVLIDAFARLADAYPLLRLQLVGDGPLRARLEQLAQSLGIGERVCFLGTRNPSEVATLLQHCDVFALPSRAEPFGIAAVEAMASACPIVASDVGGLRELIENGTSGILVTPDAPDALAHALHRVLSDAALRAKLAANALLRARERFSAARMGSDYETAFLQAVATER